MSGSNQCSEEQRDWGTECWVGGSSFRQGLWLRLQLNRDLNEGASHADVWGKNLPGRGMNKGNGLGRSVCETRPVWLGRVAGDERRGHTTGALWVGYFPFVPPHPLATLFCRLGSWCLWPISTSSLDLWLPMRFGQWEAPARNQRAGVVFTQMTFSSLEFPCALQVGGGYP